MTSEHTQTEPHRITPLQEAFNSEELESLYRRITESGELGRSRNYAALLHYLLHSAESGRPPKEIEIAMEVLGRGSEFDVGKDSLVRVYIHQLRKRLDNYYDKFEQDAAYRIVIPKGQYTVAAIPRARAAAEPEQPAAVPEDMAASGHAPHQGYRITIGLLALILILLAANLVFMSQARQERPAVSAAVSAHPMWDSILHDDLPILLVMGDYYIFGELDEYGYINRMIRDFRINSRQDLLELFMADNSLMDEYMDLDMTYMPESAAYALTQIMPVLSRSEKRINVTMMSRLSTADLRSNHIIYIGYISALDKLNNLYFAASGLQVGRTYDELFNRSSNEFYTSDAGLPEQGQAFRDLALLATFPAANGNQFVLITGTRDAGVMHSALVAGDHSRLAAIDSALEPDADGPASQEALFEVFGLDRMNFDANLLYTRELDPTRIWSRETR